MAALAAPLGPHPSRRPARAGLLRMRASECGRCRSTSQNLCAEVLSGTSRTIVVRDPFRFAHGSLFVGAERRGPHRLAAGEDLRLPFFAVLDRNELKAPVHDQHRSASIDTSTDSLVVRSCRCAIVRPSFLTEGLVDLPIRE